LGRGLLVYLPAALFLIAGAASGAFAAAPPPPPGSSPERASETEAGVLSAPDRNIWRQAFRLAGSGNHDAARLASALATDQVLRPVLEWLRLRDADTAATEPEYSRFLRHHADFPSLDLVRLRREAALIEGADDDVMRALFSGEPPLTADGKAAWALVLLKDGKAAEALALARNVWRNENPEEALEADLHDAFGQDLTRADHWERLDRLLRNGNASEARRMKAHVQADVWALARARLDLASRRNTALKSLRAVPASLRDEPGLVFEHIRYLRRTGNDAEAQKLLLSAGVMTGDLRKLWIERRVQVRNLLQEGDPATAYLIARDHGMDSGASFAHGEFEAGWLALRFLDRPREALAHFQTLFDGVSYPVSRARAAYWSARAYAVLGDAEAARTWFGRAASHPYTYYGQLALHELGQKQLVLPEAASSPQQEQARFDDSKMAGVIQRLHEIGQHNRARFFLTRLIKSSERKDIHLLATSFAGNTGSPALKLIAGKLAALQRVVIPDAAYPFAVEPGEQQSVAAALAHSITRQESAFDQYAVSHAGARGLMQLMPQTARIVAGKENMAYSLSRLTQDPAYNTRLGGAYLAEQIDRFAGYLPMGIAAYNAGPHRVDRWIEDYGDPRTGRVDPVDWAEMIVFSETRNYVQRVLEALQVYRVRFSGRRSGPLLLANDIGLKGTYLCGGRSGKPC